MNVLLLPFNIASMSAITAEALNNIEGVEAKCMIQEINKYNSLNKHTIYLPKNVSKKKLIQWLKSKLLYKSKLKKLIEWADVLHYVWSTALDDGSDLRWAQKWHKPIFVEWLGSDIRNPEMLKCYNKHFKQAFYNGYEYRNIESEDHSNKSQQTFAAYDAIPLLCPEMSLFLRKDLFPSYKSVFQRINCKDFETNFPDVNKKVPLVVHSPTAIVTKGTNVIIPVIEELKRTYEFEFLLLHNLPHIEVLNKIKEADIFLDQLVIGGYGMAAMEAMSFGKPVMTYVMPEVFALGLPKECPIVNTNIENVKEQLIKLITNGQLRYDIGVQSRLYVETYHDSDKLAQQLVSIYKEGIEKCAAKKN